MDPTRTELASFVTVADVFQWLETTAAVEEALSLAMGATTSLRSWARIPDDRYNTAVRALTIGERALTPAEEGQVGEVARIARLALLARNPPPPGGADLPLTSSGTLAAAGSGIGSTNLATVGNESADSGTVAGLTANLGAAKIKFSTVIDQGDDTEIKPLNVDELRRLLGDWVANTNDGEEPTEEQEATGEQLAALNFRLRSGGTPFVDFGVWRPHGADLGRALRFTAYFLSPTGEFQRKELAGPASFADWERSWRVFGFAMEVLGAATRTRLSRYRDQVAQLARDYPNFWWMVACADYTMRRSHLERIRRRLESEHVQLIAAGLRSAFDPARPWDYAFRDAARDSEFWAKEVDKKVIMFTTAQKSKNQLTDPGFGDLRLESSAEGGGPGRGRGRPGGDSPDGTDMSERKKLRRGSQDPTRDRTRGAGGAAGKGKTKGGRGLPKEKNAEGNFYRDAVGVNICWAWNRAANGCSDPCPSKRAHVCERCRGSHRGCDHKG